MADYPGLVLAESGNFLLASVSPSPEHPALDLAGLHELLANAGYGAWLLAEDALAALDGAYNAQAPRHDLPIAERRDASFTIDISADAMQASIDVSAAHGGQALDPDAVYLALDAAGVSFGVDRAAVNAVCAASATSTASTASVADRIVVARGTAAQDGKDTRFELLVTDARDRTPQIDEHGLIDFRDLGATPSVTADQPLLRRIPPTTGTAGRNVHGAVIEPLPGCNEPFAEGLLGAQVAADDANLLRASISGQPVRCGNGVNVEPILQVRNVNIATGNISFDGTVNIEGEVLPGMKVHASGDIVVGGIVDGAELKAGGDIHIGGGIIAKAHVEADGSIAARFVENARIVAGTTIAINDTALQSDLQANNQIIVGIKSPQRGRLAGGSARAMMLIRAPIIGSPSAGLTTLQLGVNPVLEAKYQQLQKQLEKQREEENNLEKLVKHLSAHGDKAGMLERAKASWQQSLQSWAKLLPERDALENELGLIAGARIEVGVSVDGAVDVAFSKKVAHLRRNYPAGRFSFRGDRVVFTDGAGTTSPAA